MKRQADEPMQCSEARAAIQARLDEPLPAEQETALSQHVTECKACGTYQAELGAMCDSSCGGMVHVWARHVFGFTVQPVMPSR